MHKKVSGWILSSILKRLLRSTLRNNPARPLLQNNRAAVCCMVAINVNFLRWTTKYSVAITGYFLRKTVGVFHIMDTPNDLNLLSMKWVNVCFAPQEYETRRGDAHIIWDIYKISTRNVGDCVYLLSCICRLCCKIGWFLSNWCMVRAIFHF